MPFLGQHSLQETKDFVRAKDNTIAQMEKIRGELGHEPDAGWDSEFGALKARYLGAKAFFATEAGAVMAATPLVSDSLRTTETAYKALLQAVSKEEGRVQRGDLQDLYNRLADVKTVPIDLASIQPTPDSDVDLQFMNATKPLATAVETVGSGISKGASSLFEHPLLWAIGLVTAVFSVSLLAKKVG